MELTDAITCTLREMVAVMSHMRDDETFRWFQDSYVASNGGVHAGQTYRVTMGQVRAELGLTPAP